MKILFVFHEARLTGAPIALYELVEWLAKNTKIKMSFLLLDGGELTEKLNGLGTVFYWPTNYFEKNNIFSNSTYNPKQSKLLQAIKDENYDIIYFNTLICSGIIHKLKQVKSIKIWHIHELNIAINKFGSNRLKSHQHVDYIVANSNATKLMLTKDGINKNKISIISPSINSEYINALANSKRDNFFETLKDYFIVGTSGSVIKHKGLFEYIAIAKKTNELYPNLKIKFIWVGKVFKPLRVKWLNSINGNPVIFLGAKSNPFVYYANFDVFVSCSHEESFGLAALECASLHKTLMCFDGTGGIEELVSLCNNLVIPKYDSLKFAHSIKELAINHEKNRELSEQAYRLSQNFETDKIGKQFYDYLHQLFLNKKE